MRLCNFQLVEDFAAQGIIRVGVVDGEQVREVNDLKGLGIQRDPLRALIASGISLKELELGESQSLVDIRLLPPIIQPDKFICIGLNYASHAREAGMDLPEVPTFFVKLPNAVSGPQDFIPIPRVSHRIDWEGELAVVIGHSCKDIETSEAMEYVAGYTVTNDVTARDYQFKTSQWMLGKTFDGFAPIGPWLTTLDEIDDPNDLGLTTTLNGQIVQDARTSDLIFGVPELVSFFSTVMTLSPGDVIATGTPSGIGALMNPRRWLRDGDVVSIEIEQVGRLTNTVRGFAQS